MKFATFLFEETVNPELPLLAGENAPSLGVFAACDDCGLVNGQKAATEGAAVALALADGWKVLIADGFKIDGLFSAADLTGSGCQLFCPHCAIEFET
jgi:hypothetical protein